MTYRSVALGALLVACAGAASAGDVTGKISFTGTAPKGARIAMNADPVCVRQHAAPVYGEEVIVNKNGTLKNVLVYVKEGLPAKKYETPAAKVEFLQKGCQYAPHVLGVQTGQELEVVNGDPTLHNVHSLSKSNPQFNVAQPVQGMKMTRKFDTPEVFRVKCEVHPWMGAYIGVFNHPYYAVTGDDGTFRLKNLPAGSYTIEVWHEKYGTQTMKVTVAASGAATADFTYAGK